jgi:hypothetical protein
MASTPLYQGRVLVWKRTSAGLFVGVNNPLGGFVLTVSAERITITASTLPPLARRLLRLHYDLCPAAVTMGFEKVGWAGSSLFEHECVTVSVDDVKRQLVLAVAPADGDIQRLATAFSDAGAHATRWRL